MIRSLPFNMPDGRPAYAVTTPGGSLDRLADIAELSSCADLLMLVRGILDADDDPDPDAGWLFAERLADALEGALTIAAKGVDGNSVASPFRAVAKEAEAKLRSSLREL